MRDALCLLSDEQEVTASAASTNKFAVPAAANIGAGEQLMIAFSVTEAFDSAADGASLAVSVRTDDNTGFTSATTLLTGATIAEATLTAGYQFTIPLPGQGYEDYIDVYYTVSGENFTSGKISAAIVLTPQTNV